MGGRLVTLYIAGRKSGRRYRDQAEPEVADLDLQPVPRGLIAEQAGDDGLGVRPFDLQGRNRQPSGCGDLDAPQDGEVVAADQRSAE
jgi:hypothetical protein